jgi:hypothetical protein
MVTTDRGEHAQDSLLGYPLGAQESAGGGAILGECDEEVFGADVLILERGGFLPSALQQRGKLARKVLLQCAADLREPLQLLLQLPLEQGAVDLQLLQHRGNDAGGVLQQGCQQMERLDGLVLPLERDLLRPLDRFLRFEREALPVDGH